MPTIRPSCRSSGVATEDAMISGLAPGKLAEIEIVGKSTCGSAETGNCWKATAPASMMAAVSSVVATGLSMNGEERLIVLDQTQTLRPLVRRHAFKSGVIGPGRREGMGQLTEEK